MTIGIREPLLLVLLALVFAVTSFLCLATVNAYTAKRDAAIALLIRQSFAPLLLSMILLPEYPV